MCWFEWMLVELIFLLLVLETVGLELCFLNVIYGGILNFRQFICYFYYMRIDA